MVQEALGAVVAVHVAPESAEAKTCESAKATSHVPSADEASDVQFEPDALACVQVAPESAEV